MNYILFDGNIRNSLLPFTYTRPVADIRVGILTIREKWEKALGLTTTTITEEYLEVIYRQFIIYQGMSASPILPVFGFIGGILELSFDKIRLLKFCKKPPHTNASIRTMLTFFLIFISAIASL